SSGEGGVMATRRQRLSGPALVALVAAVAAISANAGQARSSRPSWRLMDYQQTACFSRNVTTSWYGVWIKGTWTHSIQVGAARLPGGGTYASEGSIPPGSSIGDYSLGYVRVDLRPDTPLGTYTARLWATDGSTKERVPITLEVESKCGY